MTNRNGIVALALWALLLAPLLCGLGVLTHSCICDDSTECSHDAQCVTDPCQIPSLGIATHNGKAGHTPARVYQINPPILVDDVVTVPQTNPELIYGPVDGLPMMVVPDRCLPLIC